MNESALVYIQKEQYDNALLLLQKAHGVLDVVDLTRARRDKFIALQVFYNMAMCYQKLGQLEECSLCLETCLEQLTARSYASLRDKSISGRIHKMKIECRLHLQLCAIYSQLHRHKMAFEQAETGVRIAHLVVRDQLTICRYFASKVEYEAEKAAQGKGEAKESKKNPKKSAKKNAFDDDEYDEIFDEEQSRDLFYEDDDEKGSTDALNESADSAGIFQTETAFNNNLEGAVSIVERSGRLLKQIYVELLRIIKPLERDASLFKKAA